MTILNMGDSGLMIIRNREVFFKTEDQMYRFNMPYQLGSEGLESSEPKDVPYIYETYFIG